MHFCNLRTVNPDPVLLFNRIPIVVVEQVKFLGLTFDKQLSFIPHMVITAIPSSLASLKSSIFLVPAYPGCHGKEALKRVLLL